MDRGGPAGSLKVNTVKIHICSSLNVRGEQFLPNEHRWMNVLLLMCCFCE